MAEENQEKTQEKVRISISRRQVAVLLILIGLFAGGFYGYVVYATYYAPAYSVDFGGQPFSFRADLREAQKINVTPDEASLRESVASFLPKNVTIFFKPVDEKRMGWYSVEAAETVIKLTAFYKIRYGDAPSFNAFEVDDYGNITGGGGNVAIALIHPDIADGTFVRLDSDKGVITISGKSLKEFDLATVKFLMVVLGIRV